MNISFDLLENDKNISDSILGLIREKLASAISNASKTIADPIKKILKESIETEPEYTSLLSGKLKTELGIDNPVVITNLINFIIDTLRTRIEPIQIKRTGLSGSLVVEFLNNKDYDDIISNSNANIIDTKSGFIVPWAKWLLLDGTKILIKDFDVKYARGGRSGMGYMINSNNNWRVPSEFAGTISSNWITRAINKINDNTINNILQNEIEKYI